MKINLKRGAENLSAPRFKHLNYDAGGKILAELGQNFAARILLTNSIADYII